MNIYFLVEGRHTEMKVYPKWLSLLVPNLRQVAFHEEVTSNNYKIFSGEGYPSLLDNHLRNSIEDVNEAKNYDYFVICLDADDESVATREKEILDFMQAEKLSLFKHIQLKIIVQNKCIETWFLGNPRIFTAYPADEKLKKYVAFYDVKNNDPELMEKPESFMGSTAGFHEDYLATLLIEKKTSYQKSKPQEVEKESYLNELIQRAESSQHIASFYEFIKFCRELAALTNK